MKVALSLSIAVQGKLGIHDLHRPPGALPRGHRGPATQPDTEPKYPRSSDSQPLDGRARAGGGGARGPRHGAFEVYVQFAMHDHEETVLVFSKLATKKFPQVIGG
jgi:hypothetical protein